MIRALLLAAFVAFACVVANAAPPVSAEYDDLSLLDWSMRGATAPDVQEEWMLEEDTTASDFTCPSEITHTTWRPSKGTVVVQHNWMIVDGERCESVENGKSLVFYKGLDYDENLTPVAGAPPLPPKFVTIMQQVSNQNLLKANLDFGESFLMGYEERSRICDTSTVFRDRTTVFVMRPFGTVIVAGLATELRSGNKYMAVVPRFRSGICLYRVPVGGDTPDLSMSPEASESPEPNSSSGAAPTPSERPAPGSPAPGSPTAGTSPPVSPGASIPGSPSASVSPSPSQGSTNTAEDDGVCFPAHAQVELEGGEMRRMDAIRVGDRVAVANGVFSEVFAFSHKDSTAMAEFIRVESDAGVIEATQGHYLYVNGRTMAAGDVRVGDMLRGADGEAVVARKVDVVIGRGLYNPQTVQGDVVVGGVVATTYTTAVRPIVATALLAPIRAAFRVVGLDLLGGVLGQGGGAVTSMLPSGDRVFA